MGLKDILRLSLSAAVFITLFVLKFLLKPKTPKKVKRKNTLTLVGMVACGWYFIGSLLNALSGRDGISLVIEDIEMFSDRVTLFGFSFARTTVVAYVTVAVIAVLLILFRLVAVPKFTEERPKGIQNAAEAVVELVDGFVSSQTSVKLGRGLSSYMLAVAVYMIGCALTEVFGQRAPTSDLTVTFALSLLTFFLINYYGIKKKKLSGRIKSLASPSPMMFPMKIVSDVAVPVSLACRLFGNMLGGLIVMDLLKASLGGYSAGVTSAAGLFFNLFHPAIQTYIFIVLSLTFINEATEEPES